MTFYEAAIEVLRRTGRPLHFKKITEVAIRDELLSHVGKAPEVTMSERLDQEVKRADESWVLKTRPGVFVLRDEVADRLNEEAAERETDVEDVEVETDDEKVDAQEKPNGRRRRRRRRGGRGKDRDEETQAHAPTPESDRRSRRGAKDDKTAVSGRYDSVSDAVYAVLGAARRKPLTVEAIAESIFTKKLVKFHTHDRAATVQSAIVTDNQVKERSGHRPLFAAYGPNVWGLTEWGLSKAGVNKEKEIQGLVNELRTDACNLLGKQIVDLKPEALEIMVITLLERLDYSNLKVSKRTSDGDVFFTADWRRGISGTRVCIQVVGDAGIEIGKDDVAELRDTLSHYSANEGILVHLGSVGKDAVKESQTDDADTVTIIDRDALVQLLVQQGIGVRNYTVPVTMVDDAFMKALKG